MTESIAGKKSYNFALRIIKLSRILKEEKKEFVLYKQILKSGTSIGANVEEALGAQSDKDFISKMNIAYKETRETHYWLRLLRDSEIIETKLSKSLIMDCEELLKILSKIITTMKGKTNY